MVKFVENKPFHACLSNLSASASPPCTITSLFLSLIFHQQVLFGRFLVWQFLFASVKWQNFDSFDKCTCWITGMPAFEQVRLSKKISQIKLVCVNEPFICIYWLLGNPIGSVACSKRFLCATHHPMSISKCVRPRSNVELFMRRT
jgi:hypothetical protein